MAPGVATGETEVAELQKELATIYTPGKPIDDPDLFSGRPDLLADLRAEMTVDGVDFVLYGERGVGKTSLWRVLLHGKRVQRHSASATDDFVSIFLRVLASLGEQFTEDERTHLAEISSSIGTDKVASIGSKLSSEDSERPVADRKLDLNFVLDRLERRAGDLDAVVIDEFQNISKQAVQTQIIEVVKGFADRGVDVKIFIVGVADSDDDLLSSREYAQYKGRHFYVRRVPRMAESEVRDILDVRERKFQARLDDDVKTTIARIAGGYPSTAHRMALAAANAWTVRAFTRVAVNAITGLLRLFGFPAPISVEKAGVHVEDQDLRVAVHAFVRDFRENHPAVAMAYDEALASAHRHDVHKLLAALTASPTARVRFDDLANQSGISSPDLAALIAGDARGLVERINGDCRLTVRQLGPFIEALGYLALTPG
jgi:hypothetical protein